MKPAVWKKPNRSRAHTGLVNACLDLLAARGLTAWPQATVGIYDEKRRCYRKNSRRRKGIADILCLLWKEVRTGLPHCVCGFRKPYAICPGCHTKVAIRITLPGRLLAIEVKTGSGTQAKEQKSFQTDIETRGHLYLIVRKIDDLVAWLRQEGYLG